MSKENETKAEERPEDSKCIGEISLGIIVNPEGVGISMRTGCIDDAAVESVVSQLADLLRDTLVDTDIKMMLMAATLADPEKQEIVKKFMAAQNTEASAESDAMVH